MDVGSWCLGKPWPVRCSSLFWGPSRGQEQWPGALCFGWVIFLIEPALQDWGSLGFDLQCLKNDFFTRVENVQDCRWFIQPASSSKEFLFSVRFSVSLSVQGSDMPGKGRTEVLESARSDPKSCDPHKLAIKLL